MSVFYDNDITNKGRELLIELMGGATFVPTKIAIGQGSLPVGTTTRNITALVSPVKYLILNKGSKLPPNSEIPEGAYVFGGMFSNEDVTADFYFRELGLFAKAVRADGTSTDEVLYSYGNAGENAELIPAYSTTTVMEKQMDLIVYVGDTTTVNLEITSGITVTQQEFEDAIEELNDTIEAEIAKVNGKFEAISTEGTVSLPLNGWGEDNTQTVTVTGFTANMKRPFVDIVAATADEDVEWGKVWKVETVDGGMKFYARETPTSALTVKYKVVM